MQHHRNKCTALPVCPPPSRLEARHTPMQQQKPPWSSCWHPPTQHAKRAPQSPRLLRNRALLLELIWRIIWQAQCNNAVANVFCTLTCRHVQICRSALQLCQLGGNRVFCLVVRCSMAPMPFICAAHHTHKHKACNVVSVKVQHKCVQVNLSPKSRAEASKPHQAGLHNCQKASAP